MIILVKSHPEMVEGPEAYGRFKNGMKTVLAAPHSEIRKGLEEHRKESDANPLADPQYRECLTSVDARVPEAQRRRPSRQHAAGG